MTNYITTDRGGVIENTHAVHAAIVSSAGKLLYAIGNPQRMTLARSTAKPAQALAILETGAFERFGFDDGDLALMCASHSSEERHIARARRMLDKIGGGVEESDLVCGGHEALSARVNREWVRGGIVPTALCNNCSGKHVGTLAGARALGVSVAGYHCLEHPVQRGVRRVVRGLCGLEEEEEEEEDEVEIKWSGIDGCNLPAPALPLHYLARIYAALGAAADEVNKLDSGSNSKPTVRTRHLAHVYKAMVEYPELVAGEGRFCTVLMEKYQGSLVGKLGADGCYAVAVRASERTRELGSEGALGIAVKIEDGNIGILYAAVMEILHQLQIGTSDVRQELHDFHQPTVVNTAGVVTGRVHHHALRVQRYIPYGEKYSE